MSFNLNNLYPKPAIYNNAAVADQRIATESILVTGFSSLAPTTNMVMLDIQDGDVMCTVDGSEPTSTNGHKLAVGNYYMWSAAMAAQARFIAVSTSGSIHASQLQM
jgi:hypothetical protein